MFDLNMLSESLVHGTETVEASNCGITPDMAGILQINNESAEDSFLLESAIILASAKILSEGTDVEALQEGVIKNVFDKIKEIVKKMWAKIKEFFKGVRMFFDKIALNSKKFAEKYEKQIKEVKSVTIEGQDYKPENLSVDEIWKNGSKAVISNTMGGITKGEAVKEADVRSEIVKAICHNGTDVKKYCLEKMNVKPAKTNITFSGSELLTQMKEINTYINDVKAEEKAVDKLYTECLSNIDRAKKDAEKNSKDDSNSDDDRKSSGKQAKVHAMRANLMKEVMNYVNTAAGVKIQVYKSAAGQAKTAAYKGIAENRKASSKED